MAACPSCPRSRPSAAARARARRAGASSASRSTTRGSCGPYEPAEVAAELEGERVAAVERRGKYLIVRFESGRALLIHLRMTGSLRHYASGLDERPAPQGCRQVRRRIGRRLPRRAPLRHVAPARAGRARAVPRTRRSARSRSTRSSPPRASASGSRSAARRSRRRSSTSARSPASGTSTSTRRSGARASIRCARPRASTATSCGACTSAIRARARARHRAAGLDAPRLRAAGRRQRRDAERVQGLRPRRRAVRPLRHADREDRASAGAARGSARRASRSRLRRRAARRAGRRGRGARARCSRRSASPSIRICGTVQPPVRSWSRWRKRGSSSRRISS